VLRQAFSITSSPRPANEVTLASLETGSGAAFEPALKLYRKCGFIEGGAFDGYEKSPFNQFLHLELVSTQ
jgi:putative acetyltransferase